MGKHRAGSPLNCGREPPGRTYVSANPGRIRKASLDNLDRRMRQRSSTKRPVG